MSDLDGTLLDDQKNFSSDAPELIRKLRDAGHKFTIATSRSYSKIEGLIKALGIDQPVVVNNGAFIVGVEAGCALSSYTIGESMVENILGVASKYEANPIIFSRGLTEIVYVPRKPTREQQFFIDERPNDPRFVVADNTVKSISGSVFSICYHLRPEIAVEFLNLIEKAALSVSLNCTQETWNIVCIEISHNLANKGQALRWLSGFSGVPAGDFVAFGDNDNDLSMFLAAGECYAVGNATENLKKISTKVIGYNNQHGVSAFLRQFVQE